MRKLHLIIIIGLGMLFLVSCQETLEERCEREVREYTRKNCPVQVANDIILDSMTFDKTSHTVSYYYDVKGILDDADLIQRNNPRERLLIEVKNSAHLKLYKEAGYSFRYVYLSTHNKGTQLFQATFHEKDYQ